MVGAVGELQIFKELQGPLTRFALISLGNQGRNHHVFKRGELRQQLMKLEDEADVFTAETRELATIEFQDVVSGNGERTGIGFVERSHNLQQGGFTSTAGTDNADHFAFPDVKVDALEHFELAEGFMYVVYVYHEICLVLSANLPLFGLWHKACSVFSERETGGFR